MSPAPGEVMFIYIMSPVQNFAVEDPSLESPAYASKKLCSIKIAMVDKFVNIDSCHIIYTAPDDKFVRKLLYVKSSQSCTIFLLQDYQRFRQLTIVEVRTCLFSLDLFVHAPYHIICSAN